MKNHIPFAERLVQKRVEAEHLAFADITEDYFADGAMVAILLEDVVE